MYATVQVREDIITGEQTVIFAVPASLIPTITYAVTLDEAGDIEDLKAAGATAPIQLIYEVALNDNINEYTVKDVVAQDYLAVNTNADGSVNFYTNQYEVDNSTGYGKVNTYSYFRPSRENDRYYYQEDTTVYTDTAGTKYINATEEPTGTMYHGYTVYKKNGTKLSKEMVYHTLTADAVGAAQKAEDNSWYIPKGTVRRDYNGFVIEKSQNNTGTLAFSDAPFTDIYGHNVDDVNHRFVFGATLGNNGKVTLKAETGIKLSKELSAGLSDNGKAFEFILTNTTNTADGTTYPAYKLLADGTAQETFVQFENGSATATLKAGETLYIGGMIAGDIINVKEAFDTEYIVETINGNAAAAANLTVTPNAFQNAAFVNTLRGSSDLVISKEIEHPFGSEYTIPNKEFDITVSLGVESVSYKKNEQNADGFEFNNIYKSLSVTVEIFGKKHLDGRTLNADEFEFTLYDASGTPLDTVSNAADGSFKFELQFDKVGEYSFTVKEVAGTVAGVGYDSAVYSVIVTVDDNLKGQLTAETLILDGNDMPQETIGFYNTYKADGDIDVTLKGTKTLKNGELKDNQFTFELYEANEDFNASGDALKTVKNTNGKFEFELNFTADQIGNTYYYVARELNCGKTVDNIKFDGTVYKIKVAVEDDLKGGVQATVTVLDGDTYVQSLDFENEVVTTEIEQDDTPTSPKTGQRINLTELFALLIISGGWFAVAIRKLRKAK